MNLLIVWVYFLVTISGMGARPRSQNFLVGTDSSPSNLYLLDITKGLPQSLDHLQQLLTANKPFFDFVPGVDGSKLYVSRCVDEGGGWPIVLQGPGRVTVQPALGGPAKTILQTQMAVTSIRAVSPTTLLLIVNRTQAPGDQNVQELASNGLWKMNTDGTGLRQVWRADGAREISFDEDIPGVAFYTSSNSQYVLKVTKENGDQFLSFSSLSDSHNHTFAQASREEAVDIVGWTTF